MTTQKERLEKISKLDSVGLQQYHSAIFRSSLNGEERNELIEACEARLNRLDRSNAFVEQTDMSDMVNQ